MQPKCRLLASTIASRNTRPIMFHAFCAFRSWISNVFKGFQTKTARTAESLSRQSIVGVWRSLNMLDPHPNGIQWVWLICKGPLKLHISSSIHIFFFCANNLHPFPNLSRNSASIQTPIRTPARIQSLEVGKYRVQQALKSWGLSYPSFNRAATPKTYRTNCQQHVGPQRTNENASKTQGSYGKQAGGS